MLETYPLTASQDPITGEYQQVLHWSVRDKPSRMLLLQVVSIPLALLMGLAFIALALTVGKLPDRLMSFPVVISIPQLFIGLGSIVATVALHELAHGLAMQHYGAKPQYGALWMQFVFYATSPGYAFRRNTYILIALAPMVVLSCLAILGMFLLQGTGWVALLTLCAILNGAGAVIDLWVVSILLRYPRIAYVIDEMDGIRVLMPR